MIISIVDIYFYVIILFPISTLFQGYFHAINQVLFALLSILLVLLFAKKMKKESFYAIVLMTINYVYSLIVTSGELDNLNDMFYFPFVIVFLLYMSDSQASLETFLIRNQRAVRFILNAWTILVFISLFLPSSYTIEWGGATYFGSYCKSIFRLAPTCVFIMTLAFCAMSFYEDRRCFFYTLLPIASIYMGGSRTYLLVGITLFVLIWYYYVRSEKTFLLSVVPLAGILIFAISISAMADKISATHSSSDNLFHAFASISNGRTIFWLAEVKAFFSSCVAGKLFGHGFNYVYDVNQQAVNTRIWAHNDFLQILLSNGLIGLGLYLFSIKKIFRSLGLKTEKGIKKFVPLIGCFMVWFINAMFNMFLSYFCSVLALPFLVYAVRNNTRHNHA